MPKELKNKEKKVKTVKEKKHFLKDTKAELKKVIWPSPKQLINNTLAVIAIVIVVGIIVFVLDVCFEKINNYGIDRLKTIVQSNQVDEEVINETISEEKNMTEENEINNDEQIDNSSENQEETNTQTDATENTENIENTENAE